MVTVSPDLAEMIERLAALPGPDRGFVLGQLGSTGEQQLLPLLEKARQSDISIGLKGLIAEAGRDNPPDGMTQLGAEALVRASRRGQDEVAVPALAGTGLQPQALLGRLFQRLGLGG